jgi:co-chaperonin GroES (HSP10)
MTIKPLVDVVQLEIEEAKAGVLDTSSRNSAVEYAKVIAVHPDTPTWVKAGDHVFVKSWGIDIITHEGKKYYFTNLNTKAILCVIT